MRRNRFDNDVQMVSDVPHCTFMDRLRTAAYPDPFWAQIRSKHQPTTLAGLEAEVIVDSVLTADKIENNRQHFESWRERLRERFSDDPEGLTKALAAVNDLEEEVAVMGLKNEINWNEFHAQLATQINEHAQLQDAYDYMIEAGGCYGADRIHCRVLGYIGLCKFVCPFANDLVVENAKEIMRKNDAWFTKKTGQPMWRSDDCRTL